MNTRTILPLMAALALTACKKEPQYDECGNEIKEEEGYGGIGMPTYTAPAATAYVWVVSDGYVAMSEAVRVYNADDPTQHTDIAGAMDDDLPASAFCGNTTNGNVARFTVQPGTTLHWKAFNASHTKEWEGTLRNPACDDGTDCYSARITYPW